MTKDGEKVLKALVNEYEMPKDAAIRLMDDVGPLLAVALASRRKS